MSAHGGSSESNTRAGESDFGSLGNTVVAVPLLSVGAGAIAGGLLAPSPEAPAAHEP